jgi:hypothetical protein
MRLRNKKIKKNTGNHCRNSDGSACKFNDRKVMNLSRTTSTPAPVIRMRQADRGEATHDCRTLASRIPSARLFRTESEEGPLWSETIASNMITCSLLLVPIRKKLKPSKTYPAIATASNS